MTRQLRVDPPDAIHHVTNRGQRKADTYLDEDDVAFFLELLDKACDKFNVSVLGFCLMRNHFHLVLSCPDGNLARAMQYIEFRYAQRFNFWHGFSGPVFTDRYHSTLITSDEQLKQTLRYVERNPLEVGNAIVNHPWTSFGMCLGLRFPPAWLDVGAVLALFGNRQSYWKFVTEDQPTDKAKYVAGTEQFVAPQRWWRSARSLEAIDRAVESSMPPGLMRCNSTRQRDVALLLATELGVDAADVADRCGMTQSAVRTALSRIRSRSGNDVVTSSWIAEARRVLETISPRAS